MATIEFLGGVGTVTGSKFLVEAHGRQLLVECGLYQGLKELRVRNWDRPPVDPASIESVVLTHGHIDHSGYLPRLINDGFRGPVYATRATADLLKILLPDSGQLQEEEAEYHNRHGTSTHKPALPLYTADDGLKAAERVTGLGYEDSARLARGLRLSFHRAGHILGSAMVCLEIDQGRARRRLIFSGDLGRYGAPILTDPAPIGEADYIVVESTYGDRRHDSEPVPAQLERVIKDAVDRGGAIIVPAFAVGRAQELMYHLTTLERAGRIPRLPVYLDSPMAIEATVVYWGHPEDFDEEMQRMVARGASPFHPGNFHLARTTEESKAINAIDGPVLVIAGSGMATGGRVLHHLRLRLPDPRATVLLVGYQAEETRGRLLQDGAKSLKMLGEEVEVRAHVEVIHGLSAHADADGLVRWLRTVARSPKRVFVVHGEPGPSAALAARIRTELGWEAAVPGYRDRAELD